jgi:hypothetical protein
VIEVRFQNGLLVGEGFIKNPKWEQKYLASLFLSIYYVDYFKLIENSDSSKFYNKYLSPYLVIEYSENIYHLPVPYWEYISSASSLLNIFSISRNASTRWAFFFWYSDCFSKYSCPWFLYIKSNRYKPLKGY